MFRRAASPVISSGAAARESEDEIKDLLDIFVSLSLYIFISKYLNSWKSTRGIMESRTFLSRRVSF